MLKIKTLRFDPSNSPSPDSTLSAASGPPDTSRLDIPTLHSYQFLLYKVRTYNPDLDLASAIMNVYAKTLKYILEMYSPDHDANYRRGWNHYRFPALSCTFIHTSRMKVVLFLSLTPQGCRKLDGWHQSHPLRKSPCSFDICGVLKCTPLPRIVTLYNSINFIHVSPQYTLTLPHHSSSSVHLGQPSLQPGLSWINQYQSHRL